MTEKYVIVVGDKTSHGGVVLTGDPHFEICDKPAAFLGDKVHCPEHGETEIIEGFFTTMIEPNKTLAYEGCKTSCGAVLIAGGQDVCVVDTSVTEHLVTTITDEQALDIKVLFSSDAHPSDVSEYSLRVLKDVLQKAKINRVVISSTARDAYNQARVMYDNLIGTGRSQGVIKQRGLYGTKPGSKVIDVFVEMKKAGKAKGEIIKAMQFKIEELGPENVSKHAANSKIYNVFDVAPSSISDKKAFEKAVLSDHRVTKFITPNEGDPGYHFEIKQSEN